MQRESMIREMLLAVAIGLMLFAGVHTASADLLFDRGLPTANLNNAAGSNRSNFGLFKLYPDPYPTSYQVYGDDFVISGSGTYHIDTARIWVIFGSANPSDYNLKLWGCMEGDTAQMVSSSFTSTVATYAGGIGYERFDGTAWPIFYQIDFTVNQDVEAGQKYQFFVDAGAPLLDRGSGYATPYLHSSIADLSGSTQEGAEGKVWLLTLTNGNPDGIPVQTTYTSYPDYAPTFAPVDANIQLYGSQIPLPSTIYLIGSGLLGLAGLRTWRKS
jgi:hypothetical protein